MRRLRVVYVEADEGDVVLLEQACSRAGLSADFHILRSRAEGTDYLKGQGVFVDRERNPLPDVMVLGVRSGDESVIEFLRWVRMQSSCRSMPVLVFARAGTLAERDRVLAAGAAGYFQKPDDCEFLVRLAGKFRDEPGGSG